MCIAPGESPGTCCGMFPTTARLIGCGESKVQPLRGCGPWARLRLRVSPGATHIHALRASHSPPGISCPSGRLMPLRASHALRALHNLAWTLERSCFAYRPESLEGPIVDGVGFHIQREALRSWFQLSPRFRYEAEVFIIARSR
jgi:hypothetical protein